MVWVPLLPLAVSAGLHLLLLAALDAWVVQIDGSCCPCHEWRNRVFVSSEELRQREAMAKLQPSRDFLLRTVAAVGQPAAR